jgi:hypothetical protein
VERPAIWYSTQPRGSNQEDAVINDERGGRLKVPSSRRKVAGILIGGVALALASCSSGGSTNPTTTSGSGTTSSVASSSSTPGSGSSTSSTNPGVQNLPVSNTVKNQLTSAYVAFNKFKATDVIGTAPSSVYYAYDPSSGTYWAMSGFVPSQEASYQVHVSMQDAGAFGWFSQKSGGNWKARNGSFPPWCHANQFFPSGVLAVWSISAAQLTC